MKRCTKAFNVLLTPDQAHMLNELAHKSGCSKGLVLRQLVQSRFAHQCNATPTCASGRPCLVPALHAQQTQAPTIAVPKQEEQCQNPLNTTADMPPAAPSS